MNSSSSQRDPVERLAQDYLERLRKGETPDISQYTQRHPELAEQIRELFPMLGMMEDVRPADGDVSATIDGHVDGKAKTKLVRLGEYRILREVGHGGMGIVYEAEQESLGRHVALKVLKTHSLLDPKQLQRFHREARAAARLHHTNIVPVHGVGQHDGMHFYIMQFIQGQGLDQILTELKRLNGLHRGNGRPSATIDGKPKNTGAFNQESRSVAESLLAGHFNVSAGAAPKTREETLGRELAVSDVFVEGSEPRRSARGSSEAPTTEPDAPTGGVSSSAIHLPGQLEHSSLSHSSSQFFLSVARIGMQVADALAYAHGQGILHRDIKPSNLLLDTQGTVWVTDFGLAKATADHDNLTHTGDIVGTLRYMAPERFKGEADIRSDLYSLGLTLYELSALRPAFDEHDRNKLIQQVIHEEPSRLRKLNPAVPRDLETIILKAIARDPSLRYQTPQALADDLKRFVEDRPIQARRASPQERFWRWCRRNPLVAGLVAAMHVTLVALLVVGTWSYVRTSKALAEREKAYSDKHHALTQKTTALAEKEAAREEALQARDAAIGQAYRALFSETQALRLAHAEGWRYKALQKLQTLARLDSPQRDLVELRSEAVTCMGAFDALEITRFLGHGATVWSLDFSPDGTQLATAGYDGRLQIWDIQDSRQVREIVDPRIVVSKRHESVAPLPAVRFHPDGGRFVYAIWPQGVKEVALEPGQKAAAGFEFTAPARYLALDKSGRTLAISGRQGQIGIYDSHSRALKKTILTKASVFYVPVALNPAGTLLAATGPENAVEIHDLGKETPPLLLGKHRHTIRSLCFSPSGELLASASEDNSVKLWDINGTQDPLTLIGHTARVNCVAFSPDGSLTASASDDQTVRLWDTRTGQIRMALNPGSFALTAVAFSPDGSQLAIGAAGGPVCLYQLTSRQEQRLFAGHTYEVHSLGFHPRKPLLASTDGDRHLIAWDLQTGEPQHRWRSERYNPLTKMAWAPDGEVVALGLGTYYTSSGNDFAVELRKVDTGEVLRRLPGPRSQISGFAFEPSGRRLAAATQEGMTFVWNLQSNARAEFKGFGPMTGVAFLADEDKLATADFGGHVALRDLANNRTVREVVVPGGARCMAVAPHDAGLVVGASDGTLHFLALPGLDTQLTVPNAHAGAMHVATFSPDGRLLATCGADRRVVLWDVRTRRQLCALTQKATVYDLAFDSDSLRLAICGVSQSVTIWNLAMVRPGLAAIGLDWDGPLPKATLNATDFAANQPPPPVKTVRVALQPIATAAAKPFSEYDRLSALYSAGRYQELISESEKAIRAAPQSTNYYTLLTRAHLQLGQHKQVTEVAERYLKINPNSTFALGSMAIALAALENHEQAIGFLEKVVQANDLNLHFACRDLAWIYANGPEKLRDPEKALALAQRAVALKADDPGHLGTLGAVYFRLGRFENAVETLKSASKLNNAPSTAALQQLFLAMSYQRLGQPIKAAECFQRAPRIDSTERLAPYIVKKVEAIRAEAAALLGIGK
jgi:WD40 repeat protein/serine/threonine protein kinase/TPR repeat protein